MVCVPIYIKLSSEVNRFPIHGCIDSNRTPYYN
jgi:hypothetical protein